MTELLDKLRALRVLGLNYIAYDSKIGKFKAYEELCIEEPIWSIELKGFDLLKEMIPTMDEAYRIERLEKYIGVQVSITENDKGV